MLIILDYDSRSAIKLRQWPELMGMDGNDAVDIIKNETGQFDNGIRKKESFD